MDMHFRRLSLQTGRVGVTVLTKKQRKEQRKMDRRHKANQLRRNKKDQVNPTERIHVVTSVKGDCIC